MLFLIHKIRILIIQEADIGLGPFAQTAERMEAVDYSSSVFIGDRSLLARKGAPEIDPWSFLSVMTPGVWVCLVVSMLIVWTMVTLLPYISVHGTNRQLGMFNLLHQLGILLNQGNNYGVFFSRLQRQERIYYFCQIKSTIIDQSHT